MPVTAAAPIARRALVAGADGMVRCAVLAGMRKTLNFQFSAETWPLRLRRGCGPYACADTPFGGSGHMRRGMIAPESGLSLAKPVQKHVSEVSVGLDVHRRPGRFINPVGVNITAGKGFDNHLLVVPATENRDFSYC